MIITSSSTLSTLYLLCVLTFHHLKTFDQKIETLNWYKKLACALMFHFRDKKGKVESREFSFGKASMHVQGYYELF